MDSEALLMQVVSHKVCDIRIVFKNDDVLSQGEYPVFSLPIVAVLG
jgi:hypothetical protein